MFGLGAVKILRDNTCQINQVGMGKLFVAIHSQSSCTCSVYVLVPIYLHGLDYNHRVLVVCNQLQLRMRKLHLIAYFLFILKTKHLLLLFA